MQCINGQGYKENHDAEGWICAPDGKAISPMCRKHAQEVIDEYAAKLRQTWHFVIARPGDER